MSFVAIALAVLSAPAVAPSPLEEAVAAFNARAAEDPIGRAQPPLSADAVVAAVRWSLVEPSDLVVGDATRASLLELTGSGTFPTEFSLEFLTGYEPDRTHVYQVWSVRLRVPGGPHPGGTTCVRIQERMLGSRVIGPEERRVIEEWAARFRDGMSSFGRQQYLEERARAIEEDRER